MSELVKCGCGGEVKVYVYSMDGGFWHRYNVECTKCNVRTPKYDTEAEAVNVWNKAMGERKKGEWIEYPDCLKYEGAYSDDQIVC